MFRSDAWLSFLHDRGVDLSNSSVSRLDGGEVNANWKVTDQHGRSWVVRQYRVTLDPLEIESFSARAFFELTASREELHRAIRTPA